MSFLIKGLFSSSGKLGSSLFDSVTVSFLVNSSVAIISFNFLFLFFLFLILIFFHRVMSRSSFRGWVGSSFAPTSKMAYSRSRKDCEKIIQTSNTYVRKQPLEKVIYLCNTFSTLPQFMAVITRLVVLFIMPLRTECLEKCL